MERPIVIYDDDCPVCTVGKNASERLDTEKHLEFVGMNTSRGRELVRTRNLDIHTSAYYIDGEYVTEKARMMRDVLAHNGVVGFVASLPFRIPWFGDRLYELISRHQEHRMNDD
ncbi:MAG TPA: DCC1-like thiol-disulfide oxidoreductase family protein [Candidatus Paceibacterota bacterium]|nr:DCC1-like thiol-disulfide oxidoreductase family protein [Candidatus Paceibacterota bacterium]